MCSIKCTSLGAALEGAVVSIDLRVIDFNSISLYLNGHNFRPWVYWDKERWVWQSVWLGTSWLGFLSPLNMSIWYLQHEHHYVWWNSGDQMWLAWYVDHVHVRSGWNRCDRFCCSIIVFFEWPESIFCAFWVFDRHHLLIITRQTCVPFVSLMPLGRVREYYCRMKPTAAMKRILNMNLFDVFYRCKQCGYGAVCSECKYRGKTLYWMQHYCCCMTSGYDNSNCVYHVLYSK